MKLKPNILKNATLSGRWRMVKKLVSRKLRLLQLPFISNRNTNYVGAIGLESLKYVANIGLDKITEIETDLLNYATDKLRISKLKLQILSTKALQYLLIKNIHHSEILPGLMNWVFTSGFSSKPCYGLFKIRNSKHHWHT